MSIGSTEVAPTLPGRARCEYSPYRNRAQPGIADRERGRRGPGGDGTIEAMSDAADQPLDLDEIEQDLADVEVALARLDAGTYWTDEVTGADLPHDLLAANPTARRLV